MDETDKIIDIVFIVIFSLLFTSHVWLGYKTFSNKIMRTVFNICVFVFISYTLIDNIVTLSILIGENESIDTRDLG